MIQDPNIRANQGDHWFYLVSLFSVQLLSTKACGILSSETLELPSDGTVVACLADEIEIVVVTSGCG